jgi:hypothetical protein
MRTILGAFAMLPLTETAYMWPPHTEPSPQGSYLAEKPRIAASASATKAAPFAFRPRVTRIKIEDTKCVLAETAEAHLGERIAMLIERGREKAAAMWRASRAA